jgi:hypothetical protein
VGVDNRALEISLVGVRITYETSIKIKFLKLSYTWTIILLFTESHKLALLFDNGTKVMVDFVLGDISFISLEPTTEPFI